MTEYVVPGGWAQEQEDRVYLATASAAPTYAGKEPEWQAVTNLDPRSWTVMENQKSQGSCQGHSLSTAQESSIVRDGQPFLQLSRGGAYYETQRIDGIRGDRGSTISGGIKLATEIGLVSEADWPYPPRYNPTRPADYDELPKYKAGGFHKLTTYEDVWRHLVLFGAVSMGITWTRAIDQQVANNAGLVRSYGGVGGGGHALAIIGLLDRDFQGDPLPEYDGRPWLLSANSWSTNWGVGGYWLISPDATNQMLSARWSEFCGLYGAEMPVAWDPDDHWQPRPAG